MSVLGGLKMKTLFLFDLEIFKIILFVIMCVF